MRLKSKLLSLNASLPAASKVKVFSPRNCEELRIPFKADKIAKVVGKLANLPPPSLSTNGHGVIGMDDSAKIITGVLVENDFKLSLMAPEDLREYAGLNTTVVMCKQRLRLSAAGIDLIRWALEGTFGAIEKISSSKSKDMNGHSDIHMNGNSSMEEADEEIGASSEETYLVMGCVAVRWHSDGEVELEWEGNLLNDGIADAVMAVLFSVESSPAAVKRMFSFPFFPSSARYLSNTGVPESSTKNSHSHSHSNTFPHSPDYSSSEDDTDVPQSLPSRNPHAHLSPTERLERLFMFLEAQFGNDALTPIAVPKILQSVPVPLNPKIKAPATPATPLSPSNNSNPPQQSDDEDEDIDDEAGNTLDEEELKRVELERLHKAGIPVPGIEIKVDKMVAKVWLEDLEVECANRVFGDRVKAVVERAVEVVAPLWG